MADVIKRANHLLSDGRVGGQSGHQCPYVQAATDALDATRSTLVGASARCAVLNGDILEKWKAQEKAAIEPIDPEVQQFLERSQLAAA